MDIRNPPPLLERIETELTQPVGDGIAAAVAEVRRRHGDAVAATLFYGSCLRDGQDVDRVIDFYVVVERYRDIHRNPLWAVLNALLPPNVYYLDAPFGERRVRAKYAVISIDDLAKGTSPRALLSTLWGRLSQPCALVYARDPGIARRIAEALVSAAETVTAETVALMPEQFPAAELWRRGFVESYRTEFRAERANRSDTLIATFPERYDAITGALASAGRLRGATIADGETGRLTLKRQTGGRARRAARFKWWLRRLLGKSLHPLRLAKAAFTFQGGLDYLLWKIENHSGVRTEPTPWQRRHPLLAAPALAWRLKRRGAFR